MEDSKTLFMIVNHNIIMVANHPDSKFSLFSTWPCIMTAKAIYHGGIRHLWLSSNLAGVKKKSSELKFVCCSDIVLGSILELSLLIGLEVIAFHTLISRCYVIAKCYIGILHKPQCNVYCCRQLQHEAI